MKMRYKRIIKIIVKRKKEREKEIEEMIEEKGLKVERRRKGKKIEEDKDVIMGDKIGEMGIYMKLKEIELIGN